MSTRLKFESLEAKPVPSVELAPGGLVDIFGRNSTWIWIQEDEPFTDRSPDAPGGEQRAFRKVLASPDPGKAPTHLSIVVAADNYFAMYVNGILLHAINHSNEWNEPSVYQVPLDANGRVVIAIRVVNKLRGLGDTQAFSPAGLRVAGRVRFTDDSTETFFTGSDQTWLVAREFDEGWEETGFDDRSRTWNTAIIVQRPEIWAPLNLRPDRMMVASSIPTLPPPPQPSSPPNCTVTSGNVSDGDGSLGMSGMARGVLGGTVTLSKGELAGVIVGPAFFTLLVTAMLTFLWTRRRYKPPTYLDKNLYTPYGTRPMREVAPVTTQ